MPIFEYFSHSKWRGKENPQIVALVLGKSERILRFSISVNKPNISNAKSINILFLA